MKITFLGTGTSQGIPIIGSNHEVCLSTDIKDKRLRSSVMISWDKFQYIIDCGPDFRQQLLLNNISDIDGILFTHHHADHTAGLDDVRPFSHKYGSVPIYAKQEVIDNLKERFAYIFTTVDKYKGAPNIEVNVIENKNFILGNIKVEPIEIQHGKINIFGFRFGKIAYITDASFISNLEIEKLSNLDVLVINALRIEKHPTHFNLEQALAFIEKVNPKSAYLTHISHKLGFHHEVSKKLPKNVFLAYDGLQIEV